jgi:hypothetical protein
VSDDVIVRNGVNRPAKKQNHINEKKRKTWKEEKETEEQRKNYSTC